MERKRAPEHGAGKAKRSKVAATAVDDDEADPAETVVRKANAQAGAGTMQSRTVLEQFLRRPDTVMGDDWRTRTGLAWFVDIVDANPQLVYREGRWCEGLAVLLKELLDNATTAATRCESMTTLRVTIEAAQNRFVVANDAEFPIGDMEIADESFRARRGGGGTERTTTVEAAFTKPFVSTNYDPALATTGAGTNGYGGTGVMAFSTDATVQVVCGGDVYRQRFERNLQCVHEPERGRAGEDPFKSVKPDNMVTVNAVVDVKRLEIAGFDADDNLARLRAVVYVIAATLGSRRIIVMLNGQRVPTSKVIALALDPARRAAFCHVRGDLARAFTWSTAVRFPGKDAPGDDAQVWEIGLLPLAAMNVPWARAPTEEAGQLTLINHTPTWQGGSHARLLRKAFLAAIAGLPQCANLPAERVAAHFWVYGDCVWRAPLFTGPSKRAMNLPEAEAAWVDERKLVANFETALCHKLSGLDAIVAALEAERDRKDSRRANTALQKTRSLLNDLATYVAAPYAGKRGVECTLWAVEGNSTMATAKLMHDLLEPEDAKRTGYIAFKGMVISGERATDKAIRDDPEFQRLTAALGLTMDRTYYEPDGTPIETQLRTLRYRYFCPAGDMDMHGTNFNQLQILLLHRFWPQLVRHGEFIRMMRMPYMRVAPHGALREPLWFDTEQALATYTEEHPGTPAATPFKGLGSYTKNDLAEIFSLERCVHRVEMSDEAIVLLRRFNDKDNAEGRRAAIRAFDEHRELVVRTDPLSGARSFSFAEWLEIAFVCFMRYDASVKLPHVVDGLPTTRRKLAFMLHENKAYGPTRMLKSTALVGAIMPIYDHSDEAAGRAIASAAAPYVGANNVNLFGAGGNFGNRDGDEPANPRYTRTYLTAEFAKLCPPHLVDAVQRAMHHGERMEPAFLPFIVPGIYVNGLDTVCTGFRMMTIARNCRQLVQRLRAKLRGDKAPWVDPEFEILNWMGRIRQATPRGPVKFDTPFYWKLDGDIFSIVMHELPPFMKKRMFKDDVVPILRTRGIITEFKMSNWTPAASAKAKKRGDAAAISEMSDSDNFPACHWNIEMTLAPNVGPEKFAAEIASIRPWADRCSRHDRLLMIGPADCGVEYASVEAHVDAYIPVMMGVYERARQQHIDRKAADAARARARLHVLECVRLVAHLLPHVRDDAQMLALLRAPPEALAANLAAAHRMMAALVNNEEYAMRGTGAAAVPEHRRAVCAHFRAVLPPTLMEIHTARVDPALLLVMPAPAADEIPRVDTTAAAGLPDATALLRYAHGLGAYPLHEDTAEELRAQVAAASEALAEAEAGRAVDAWIADLHALEAALEAHRARKTETIPAPAGFTLSYIMSPESKRRRKAADATPAPDPAADDGAETVPAPAAEDAAEAVPDDDEAEDDDEQDADGSSGVDTENIDSDAEYDLEFST